MNRKSIQHRRQGKKITGHFELQLTSLMDILVIIVVFLLKNYSVSTNHFSTAPTVQLPFSLSSQTPLDSLLVQLSTEQLFFEQEPLVSLSQARFHPRDLDTSGHLIPRLYERLTQDRQKKKSDIVALQVDREVPYQSLQKILHTLTQAGFPRARLIALHQGAE